MPDILPPRAYRACLDFGAVAMPSFHIAAISIVGLIKICETFARAASEAVGTIASAISEAAVRLTAAVR
ncbi:hypothetical protein [Caulobacter sp. DWR1-3-2b1]|uniref:hypothetical protein n=1 Tax=Caulobacter sp. DWR1-3-2b1 TaxID=2804670 RepID=UPI003CF1C81C